ncbi:hypothetical protein CEP54_014618, partial [Fusarium duplospermum]
MAEPGTPAPDIPAIYARLRWLEKTFNSRSKEMEQSLADLRATLQAGEPISSERRTSRSSARRKARPLPARSRDDIASLLNKASEDFASFVNDTRKDFAALTNETHEKLNALAKRIHPLPQASQEPQARAEGNDSPIAHGALGQEQGDPGREVRQSSADDATHGLTRSSAGHLGRKDAHGDSSVTSIEASGDTPMRDYYQVQPSPPGSAATTAATASACQSAPRQATGADSRPEDGTDRLVGVSTPDRHKTTPLLIPNPASRGPSPNDSMAAEEQQLGETVRSRGDTASSQVSTPSPSSGTTPQGSDTTGDTSRASTPDTHLTSPDTSVPGSTPKLTLSEADMGERLVEALGRIKRDDSMHKISAPNLPIDLDILKKKFSAPNHDCQYAANTFVPGPEGEGYTNVHISERRSDFAWPDFSEEVAIPTKEEARKWLDDFCDNPPEKIIPYFSGHLDVPSHEHLLNPGPAILGRPELADLHRPYWHIGGDRSANRFHIEDYNCSEDKRPYGLRSANLVLKGVKIWIGIKRHHTKKFEAFIARNWDCNGCSQHVGHQSLLIAPWRLEREGIDFVIEVQGPMEL